MTTRSSARSSELVEAKRVCTSIYNCNEADVSNVRLAKNLVLNEEPSYRTEPSALAAFLSSSSLMLVIIASVVSMRPAIDAAF